MNCLGIRPQIKLTFQVDEAQDLGVPELRLFAAIAASGPNSLFFAGDLGQRIFQQPFSWTTLGVGVRGRSSVLKVNYRTSHQIRQAADRLMPKVVRDVDGVEEERFGTVSVFNGWHQAPSVFRWLRRPDRGSRASKQWPSKMSAAPSCSERGG
jgi:hypothetical protein